jgi:soluble P-type ATPase
VRALRRAGVARVGVVTGDPAASPAQLRALLGVDDVHVGRSPAEKVDDVARAARQAPVLFAGDGINDAPALAAADVGVALAGSGVALAAGAADVVVIVDRLDRVADAVELARRTRRVVVQTAGGGIALSVIAMVAAAAGALPAAPGALVQELIDVVAVTSALRAGAPLARPRLGPADAAAGERARLEHEQVRAVVDELRRAGDALATGATPAALAAARAAHDALVTAVLPHERSEEASLYPGVDRALGGTEPTAPMRLAHAEIGAQVARLGELVRGTDAPTADELAELRHLLYGLHAILELHTAQEEESYGGLLAESTLAAPRARHRTA